MLTRIVLFLAALGVGIAIGAAVYLAMESPL
jgi:hypothetical protein